MNGDEPQAASASQTTDDLWNEWLHAAISRNNEMLVDALGEETGAMFRELRAEIETLRAQTDALRADLTLVRSLISGKTVALPARSNDAAA